MILVTGAGGNVGSEVMKRLSASGVTFQAGYHSSAKADAARASGVRVAVVDFAKPETIRAALQGVDGAFLASGNGPDQTRQEINFVREARTAGLRLIVKLSVWGAEGEDFFFARIHRPVEDEIEASGIPYVLLRPNGFMQNVVNYMGETIRAQNAFYLPAGEAPVSYVDVRDIGNVAAKALTERGHEGTAYDLSGPEALTCGQIAEKLSAVLGRKITYVNIPEADYRKGALAAGVPDWLVDNMLDLMRYYIDGQASRVTQDVRHITGNDPIPFDRFARDYAEAFRPR